MGDYDDRGYHSIETVTEALEHFASIDLIELCNEAKVERCRATRDLRSCGREVQHVLNSCGHASLCKECSRRCDFCPICRIPIPKNGNILRLRLYYECIEAGLISDRFEEKGGGEGQLTEDVKRLYSLFDVALESNLVSLICHYVTDVCMDESAVSSDPVIAFLLDEVVVKDWCKRTLRVIMTGLHGIYNLEAKDIKTSLGSLLKFSMRLTGISNVIEVLESSFKGTLSAQLHGLHQLQESILKTKQHLEIMMWCIRHQFLENVRSRYTNFTSWRFAVRERTSAAIARSWPDSVNHSVEPTGQNGSLFIEDALLNLEIEQGYMQEMREEFDVASLQKDGGLSVFKSKIDGMAGCYPFENLRAATDILFLRGNSDLVVAKQAIFLYYLFDRHWTVPSEKWRHIVDDFAATFSITRHSLLESFTFYLLDDHTDAALQEACHILPEISGPETHPKIAQVLLERQNPDAALMVLRWSGRDGAQLVSLGEAVTAIRVRVECGLLTEAFMYQRMLCMKIKERKLKHGPCRGFSDDLKDECRPWADWVEALITEICCLCIRRNLVDRMIELPWDSDEEKYLHKCLLEYAINDPSTTAGSLLVVFYLQRYRYPEAFQVDKKLQNVEQDFISKKSVSEEVLIRMRSASHWRAGLVDRSMELLPEVQQQQVKNGKLPEIGVTRVDETDQPAKSDIFGLLESNSTSLLVHSSADHSLLWVDQSSTSLKPSIYDTPKVGGSVSSARFEPRKDGSMSLLHERFFTNSERGLKPQIGISKNFKFDEIPTSRIHSTIPLNASPLKDLNRSSLRVLQNSNLQGNQRNSVSPELQQNGFSYKFKNSSPPYSQRVMTGTAIAPSSNHGLHKSSVKDSHPNASNKRLASDGPDRPWNVVSSDDPMDVSWRHGEDDFTIKDWNANGRPRWRSDETSEDEEEQSPERVLPHTTTLRGIRRSRVARR
ncbi:E3 ubiquitin-protein ligase HOS1 isoform X2 [Malania oleifera]|nr:E3 ubiquitin-protein ligase HOS1 isoform X2 [Malania oleifera]